jgi:hypothetical protein
MTALSGGLEIHSWICRKHEKIEKVTGAQDDDFVGVLKKNIPNKLARPGRSPALDWTTEKTRSDDWKLPGSLQFKAP